jgi:hypothetical protein
MGKTYPESTCWEQTALQHGSLAHARPQWGSAAQPTQVSCGSAGRSRCHRALVGSQPLEGAPEHTLSSCVLLVASGLSDKAVTVKQKAGQLPGAGLDLSLSLFPL